MDNRFGLKDFVLLLMVAVVGLLVVLGMVQKDRDRLQARGLAEKIENVERQIAQLRPDIERVQTIEKQLGEIKTDVASAVAAGVSAARSGGAPTPATSAAAADGWARPGVPVAKQPAWAFQNDPRTLKGFKPGGEFTEIFEAQLAKLTPYIQTDVYGRRIIDITCEMLGSYDPQTLRLRGVLAEAWQADPDGRWLRVKLHDRARFSDGKPVTAEDVRYTFHDFIMNPQIEAQRTRSIIGDIIEKVEVISDKVVEFTFRKAFFSNLDAALTMHILPKHFYEKFSPAEINKSTGLLMGSGPYKLERLSGDDQWTPGQTVELVRNELYWGTPSPIERMRFRAINDELPRLTAYKNGEGDMITPSAPQFASLKADAEFAAGNQLLDWTNMRSGNSFIAWNCGERRGKLTPFADKRVRRAMTMLINREKMIRDIWKGFGQVGKGSWLPGTPGNDPNLKPWPYDPPAAMKLLEEAGWKDRDGNGILENAEGREFEFEFLYFTGGEIAQRIALFVQDAMTSAGIRCTLNGVDWSVGDPIRKQRDFDALTMAWGANAPESDPRQIYHSESMKDQGDNFAQWSNPEADRLIDMGRVTLDDEKRFAIWREFEKVMHEDQPYTWIRVAPWLRVVKGDVANVNKYPKGLEVWEFFRGGPQSPMPN